MVVFVVFVVAGCWLLQSPSLSNIWLLWALSSPLLQFCYWTCQQLKSAKEIAVDCTLLAVTLAAAGLPLIQTNSAGGEAGAPPPRRACQPADFQPLSKPGARRHQRGSSLQAASASNVSDSNSRGSVGKRRRQHTSADRATPRRTQSNQVEAGRLPDLFRTDSTLTQRANAYWRRLGTCSRSSAIY